ncbi:arginine/serine-rich coiled-coil protein 2 isoform X1 [Pocillopora verrucosa]|uniref:arginine/serine-rich coiled-coil protein 2 isoform X1 n=1 Tax=Pocillopora verrucosa TaxID=203993 RepID=UPI0027973347|nr:arginine/serine-rich coiled-coil protein 2-like isoform X1 [Pocillopora verrucosa]XP_058973244.1 arginine/serine-rich coiled-coil protein 2-like isoform X1 [Pocillopora verrucosa]
MESYPVNQCDNQEPESGEPQEATENRKEMLHHSSKRKGSPRNQQRNYRRRSFSESPERSPERSKEQSPVSRRQNRHSDQGDYHRYRRSRSRSRSRSPRRRRRSHSPRNERDETSDQAKEGKHSQSLGKIPSEREKAQQLSVRRGSNTRDEEDMEKSPPRGKTARSKSSDRDSSSPQRRNSPKRRSKTPDQRRRRSPCRERRVSCERKSPERPRRRDNRKSPQRDSRDRRSSGDYSRRHERDRDRARNREREGRGGRDWGRDRRYDRDRDGDRDRNRERDRDRSREDEKVASPGQDKKTFVKASANCSFTATSTGQLETLPRPARPLTSEEVQAKLAAHAESLRKQAQDAASMLNLPSYLNPSVVNPHQYAVQAQKRKLLWSGKKTTEATASTSSSVPKSTMWNSTTFSNDQGGEMQAKFRRLMGIKGEGNATTTGEVTQPQNQKLMDDLEKEFERSRAFQLSRGAGGKSGIGLGYSGT